MKRKNKGLTLVETMITLLIFTILLAIVSPFFISNYRALFQSETKMDLQLQGEEILDSIKNNAMEASKIEELIDEDGNNRINEKSDISASKVKFNILEIDENSGKIVNKSKEINFSSSDLKKKIDMLQVKLDPLPAGTEFNDARGIHIFIRLENGDISKNLETTVYFRNYNGSVN